MPRSEDCFASFLCVTWFAKSKAHFRVLRYHKGGGGGEGFWLSKLFDW